MCLYKNRNITTGVSWKDNVGNLYSRIASTFRFTAPKSLNSRCGGYTAVI